MNLGFERRPMRPRVTLLLVGWARRAAPSGLIRESEKIAAALLFDLDARN